MSLNTMDRRSALRAALGVAGAAAAASLVGAVPAEAHGRHHPLLPDVPGMVGDRWANEFWYQYDEISYFTPTQEMKDAVAAIVTPSAASPRSTTPGPPPARAAATRAATWS